MSSGPTIRQGNLLTDTISENTSAAGVTIDSVLLKDGNVSATNVEASGALQVTGTSTLDETNAGAATMGSLNVTGSLNVDGNTGIDTNTSLNTASSTGTATFQSVGVSGNNTNGGWFAVTGNTSLSTLGTSGLATMNSVQVTNTANVTGSVTATGDTEADTISERTAGSGVTADSVLLKDGGISAIDVSTTGNLSVTGTSTIDGNATFSAGITAYSRVQQRDCVEFVNETQSSSISGFNEMLWQTTRVNTGDLTISNSNNRTTVQVGKEGVYTISFSSYVQSGSGPTLTYIRIASNRGMTNNLKTIVNDTQGGYSAMCVTFRIPADYYIDTALDYGSTYIYGDNGVGVRYPRLCIVRISW